jgi:hypothetical protein
MWQWLKQFITSSAGRKLVSTVLVTVAETVEQGTGNAKTIPKEK